MLGDKSSVSRDEIEAKVNQVLEMPDYSICDRSQLIREAESIYKVRVDEYRIIEKEERRLPWLNGKRSEIDWNFWSRYRRYLQDDKNFAPDTLNKLNRLTDRILDSLFDPTANIQIDKKGLVVGQVQSGKTSNYTGLICKASDAGFRLIIVLAGIHNNLRSQTQLRLDEGFLGFDTQLTRAYNQNNIRIGVGLINRNGVAHSLTSSLDNGDFTQGAANASGFNFDTGEPIIAVVKKNPYVLDRLYKWLYNQANPESYDNKIISSKSLLMIDDEADYASINTNKPEWQPTRINRQIRSILNIFRKSGYVGYTATPFANIFIPLKDDDLFPRDFIINIPSPSNYIGPEKVFGFRFAEQEEITDDVLPIINRIEDCHDFVPDRHKQNDPLPSSIPSSLMKAMRCFILTCAIRRLRGQTLVHNSMLIHVSRFRRWQDHITELVQKQFDYYRMGIDQNDPEVLDIFKSTFEEDQYDEKGYCTYKSYVFVSNQILSSPLSTVDSWVQVHSWKDLLPHLSEAVSRIDVREIHGGSREALDYYDHKNGLSVIVIGGNKLSRGLTLEGLSVSYFLRSSRMYDTLMQMGRWFGYRPGYVDLCRLFTSRELNEHFCHITRASEELREEFDYMADVAGSTPEQYALKVRTHPGILQISATNKMRSVVNVQLSWAGRLVESYELIKNPQTIAHNLKHTRDFILSLTKDYEVRKYNFVWYDIPADKIIELLNGIYTPENLKAYVPRNLIKFITAQLPNGELTSWRVALMSKQNASRTVSFCIRDISVNIGCWVRTQDEYSSNTAIYYLRKSHIISPDHECIDLTDSERARAMELTKEHRLKQNKEGEPQYPNGEIIRNNIRNPQNPLLLIYLLDPVHAKMPDSSDPFMGYAISFPGSRYEEYITYAVHEQLLEYLDTADDEEDFDESTED